MRTDSAPLDLSALSSLLRWPALALFVVCATLYLLTLSLAATVFRPEAYHRMLDDLRIGERARLTVTQVGLTHALPLTAGEDRARDLPELSSTAWEAMTEELIPVEWVNTQAHRMVDEVFAWMEGDDPLPSGASGEADLGLVIDRLQSPNGALALLPLLSNLPDCAPGETPTGQGVYASCLPAEGDVEALARQTAARLKGVLPRSAGLPALLALELVEPEAVQHLDRVRFIARWLPGAAGLLGSLSLFFFALYGLAALRSWRDLLLQPVLPLALVGALSLVLAIGLWLTAQAGRFNLFASDVGVLLPSLLFSDELRREAVAYWGRAAAMRLGASGAGALLVAAILGGASFLIARRQRKAIEAPTSG
ncbi:MAG: hypothetical protein ACRDH2_09240 [Anaerolineales bacterium]